MKFFYLKDDDGGNVSLKPYRGSPGKPVVAHLAT